jgi:hypothetical protein
MNTKNKKYRLISQVNNACNPPYELYIIEKRKRFLFWTWWSQDYLFDRVYCCYEYHSLEEAKNMMEILTGRKKWIVKTELS